MDNKTYLALGDSYTIGESVPLQDNFPMQTAGLLREKGWLFENPKIIAKTGWTSFELLEAIEKEKVNGNFDLVTLLVGVNNQYRGLSPALFANDFALLVEKALYFSDNHPESVLILSIPDWGATPYASLHGNNQVSSAIEEFNGISKMAAESKGIRFIDVTIDSLLVRTDTTLLVEDQLHYTGKMYGIWAKKIVESFTS